MPNVGEADLQIGHSGEGETVGALNSVGSALTSLGTIAAGAALAGLVALGSGFGTAVSEAMEAQKVMAQTTATIESTGGAAGMSAEQISDLASSLASVTPFADDLIQSGENLLLTFTNIGADVFPAATQAMLDMSTAMGQDLKSSAIQLGKALNDPLVGITALQRVGVTFTQTQIDMIENFMEMGDVASAQGVILQELSKEFGGSAEAAGKTFAGQMEIFKNSVLDSAEALGLRLLPYLSDFARMVGPELQAAMSVGLSLFDAFESAVNAKLVPAFRALIEFGDASQLALMLPPGLQVPFLELAGAVGSLGEALASQGPGMTQMLQGIGGAISRAFDVAGPQTISNLAEAVNNFATIVQTVGPVIIPTLTMLGQIAAGAAGGLATFASAVLAATTQLATGDFQGALDTLAQGLTGFADSISQAVGGVNFSEVLTTWQGNLENLGVIVTTGMTNLGENIMTGLTLMATQVASSAAGVGSQIAAGIASGISGGLGAIIGAAVAAVEAAIAAAKAAAGIQSPSKEGKFIGGMMTKGVELGLLSGIGSLMKASDSLTGSLLNNLSQPLAYGIPGGSISSSTVNKKGGDLHIYQYNEGPGQSPGSLLDMYKDLQV